MFASLTISWPYLLVALALLWFPRQWMRTGKSVLKKRRKPDGALERLAGMGARDPEDRSVQPSREFTNFRNYLDLFRAFAGGYCLTQLAVTSDGADSDLTALIIKALVMLVAVVIQSVRFDERLSFFAPLFFLLGLTAGTCGQASVGLPLSIGHATGLFAFALVLAVNPVIPNPRMFLTAFGLLMLPFGYVFGADLPLVSLNAALILLPPFLSLLTKRPVVIFSRKAKSASATN
jgi:hypothetical protein